MNNFELILDQVDFTSINKEVEENQHLFGILPLRTNYEGSAHKEVRDILLRGPRIEEDITLQQLQCDMQCYNYMFMKHFPMLHLSLLDLMRHVFGCQLGRVMITKLPPGGKITPHKDEGQAAEEYERFHIVLRGEEGNMFFVEDQSQEMLTGQVWWFNNNKEHWVKNNSNSDRIHVIVDIMVDQW